MTYSRKKLELEYYNGVISMIGQATNQKNFKKMLGKQNWLVMTQTRGVHQSSTKQIYLVNSKSFERQTSISTKTLNKVTNCLDQMKQILID